jgi:hypothetical protein
LREVALLTGINLDELRTMTDNQLIQAERNVPDGNDPITEVVSKLLNDKEGNNVMLKIMSKNEEQNFSEEDIVTMLELIAHFEYSKKVDEVDINREKRAEIERALGMVVKNPMEVYAELS